KGGLVDADHRETVKIPLLHLAVLEGDLAMLGKAQAHDSSALDLRLDALRVDVCSTIDGGVDPGYRELALFVNRHLDHGRDIADEAPVYGNAEPVSFGHGPPPAAFVRDEFNHLSKSGGIDGIAVVRLAVVPEVLHGSDI